MRYLRYLTPMVFLGIAMGCATQPSTDNGDGADTGPVVVDSGVTTGRLSDDGAQPGAPMPGDPTAHRTGLGVLGENPQWGPLSATR